MNLSIGLVKNLKEALTRYQGNYDVEADGVLDLTRRDWNHELSAEEIEHVLVKYRVRRIVFDSFFGKKFIKLQNSRNLTEGNTKHWNIGLSQYVVMHSFFDYHSGRKMVHFRTPYKIHNYSGKDLRLEFKDNRIRSSAWM